ncbi:MAG: hypothetical protein WA417_22350 [Stellaceae bacterium]|jgi:hypothetical protein
MLPAGADPGEVRDWFEFETIVSLPAQAASFAEAEAPPPIIAVPPAPTICAALTAPPSPP